MANIYRTPLLHIPFDTFPQSAQTFATSTLNSTLIRVAWAGWLPTTANAITAGGFRLGTITDGGAMPTYRLSLQGLTTAGVPDGTIKGGGSPVSVTFVPTVANGFANSTFTWLTFANSYTPSIGEALCMVLDLSSGTPSASNNISVTYQSGTGYMTAHAGRPYALVDLNAAWTTADKISATGALMFGWKTASDVFGFPFQTSGATSFSNVLEVGARFTLDSGWASTATCLGARCILTTAATTVNLNLALYSGGESSPSQLALSQNYVSDHMATLSAVAREVDLLFSTGVTLTYGSQYHMALSVSSGASPAVTFLQFNASGDMNCLPYGPNWCMASRAITFPSGSGGNAFTSSATQLTQRPMIFPLLTDVTFTGGGSSVIGANMRGGFVN